MYANVIFKAGFRNVSIADLLTWTDALQLTF